MHSFNKKTSYLYMEIKFLDEIKLKIIFIIIKCCFKFILFIYLFIFFLNLMHTRKIFSHGHLFDIILKSKINFFII